MAQHSRFSELSNPSSRRRFVDAGGGGGGNSFNDHPHPPFPAPSPSLSLSSSSSSSSIPMRGQVPTNTNNMSSFNMNNSFLGDAVASDHWIRSILFQMKVTFPHFSGIINYLLTDTAQIPRNSPSSSSSSSSTSTRNSSSNNSSSNGNNNSSNSSSSNSNSDENDIYEKNYIWAYTLSKGLVYQVQYCHDVIHVTILAEFMYLFRSNIMANPILSPAEKATFSHQLLLVLTQVVSDEFSKMLKVTLPEVRSGVSKYDFPHRASMPDLGISSFIAEKYRLIYGIDAKIDSVCVDLFETCGARRSSSLTWNDYTVLRGRFLYLCFFICELAQFRILNLNIVEDMLLQLVRDYHPDCNIIVKPLLEFGVGGLLLHSKGRINELIVSMVQSLELVEERKVAGLPLDIDGDEVVDVDIVEEESSSIIRLHGVASHTHTETETPSKPSSKTSDELAKEQFRGLLRDLVHLRVNDRLARFHELQIPGNSNFNASYEAGFLERNDVNLTSNEMNNWNAFVRSDNSSNVRPIMLENSQSQPNPSNASIAKPQISIPAPTTSASGLSVNYPSLASPKTPGALADSSKVSPRSGKNSLSALQAYASGSKTPDVKKNEELPAWASFFDFGDFSRKLNLSKQTLKGLLGLAANMDDSVKFNEITDEFIWRYLDLMGKYICAVNNGEHVESYFTSSTEAADEFLLELSKNIFSYMRASGGLYSTSAGVRQNIAKLVAIFKFKLEIVSKSYSSMKNHSSLFTQQLVEEGLETFIGTCDTVTDFKNKKANKSTIDNMAAISCQILGFIGELFILDVIPLSLPFEIITRFIIPGNFTYHIGILGDVIARISTKLRSVKDTALDDIIKAIMKERVTIEKTMEGKDLIKKLSKKSMDTWTAVTVEISPVIRIKHKSDADETPLASASTTSSSSLSTAADMSVPVPAMPANPNSPNPSSTFLLDNSGPERLLKVGMADRSSRVPLETLPFSRLSQNYQAWMSAFSARAAWSYQQRALEQEAAAESLPSEAPAEIAKAGPRSIFDDLVVNDSRSIELLEAYAGKSMAELISLANEKTFCGVSDEIVARYVNDCVNNQDPGLDKTELVYKLCNKIVGDIFVAIRRPDADLKRIGKLCYYIGSKMESIFNTLKFRNIFFDYLISSCEGDVTDIPKQLVKEFSKMGSEGRVNSLSDAEYYDHHKLFVNPNESALLYKYNSSFQFAAQLAFLEIFPALKMIQLLQGGFSSQNNRLKLTSFYQKQIAVPVLRVCGDVLKSFPEFDALKSEICSFHDIYFEKGNAKSRLRVKKTNDDSVNQLQRVAVSQPRTSRDGPYDSRGIPSRVIINVSLVSANAKADGKEAEKEESRPPTPYEKFRNTLVAVVRKISGQPGIDFYSPIPEFSALLPGGTSGSFVFDLVNVVLSKVEEVGFSTTEDMARLCRIVNLVCESVPLIKTKPTAPNAFGNTTSIPHLGREISVTRGFVFTCESLSSAFNQVLLDNIRNLFERLFAELDATCYRLDLNMTTDMRVEAVYTLLFRISNLCSFVAELSLLRLIRLSFVCDMVLKLLQRHEICQIVILPKLLNRVGGALKSSEYVGYYDFVVQPLLLMIMDNIEKRLNHGLFIVNNQKTVLVPDRHLVLLELYCKLRDIVVVSAPIWTDNRLNMKALEGLTPAEVALLLCNDNDNNNNNNTNNNNSSSSSSSSSGSSSSSNQSTWRIGRGGAGSLSLSGPSLFGSSEAKVYLAPRVDYSSDGSVLVGNSAAAAAAAKAAEESERLSSYYGELFRFKNE